MSMTSPFASATTQNGVSAKGLKKEDILRTLEAIRANRDKRTGYSRPEQYEEFMPKRLDVPEPDTSRFDQRLRSIENQGDQALQLSMILAQNKLAKQQMLKAKKAKKRQHQQIQQQQQQSYTAGSGGASPGPIKGFNPNAPLRNYNWHGYSLRLNSSVAGRFIGFLNALSARGYKIKSIGTYSNRNIAGTNIQSLHALGLAMDINPSDNPVTWNGHVVTNLPPGVGALAARYGLKWGGAWRGPKMDPMHFSVPYGGRY